MAALAGYVGHCLPVHDAPPVRDLSLHACVGPCVICDPVVSADPEAHVTYTVTTTTEASQGGAIPYRDTWPGIACDPCQPDCHESGCHDLGGEA